MTGRHRRPRPVRDFLVGLRILHALRWRSERILRRRVRSARPEQVRKIGAQFAAAITQAQTPWTAERIPLQVSLAEHYAGVNTIEGYRIH